MKKILSFLIITFLCLPMMVFAFVKISNYLYVTDDANVLSDESEEYIMTYSDFLKREKNVRFYVVTVENLEGIDLDSYASEVFRIFQLGDKGLLVFFTKEERTIKVLAGRTLSHFLTDDVIQDSIDLYFIPYLKNDEWNEGIINGYSSLYKIICSYYHIDASPMEVYDGNDIFTKYKSLILMGIITLATLIGYMFCRFIKKFYSKKRGNRFQNNLVLIMLFITNIVLLFFSYSLETISVLFVLGAEVVAIVGAFSKESNTSFKEALYRARAEEKRKEIQLKSKHR